MSYPYPYKIETEEPPLQYEEFDGAKFGYMLWPSHAATNQVKGRILLVHGFGEYTRIQYRLMDHLSQQGYESFTFDQRGAGVTSPDKTKGLTNELHTFKDLEHFIKKNLKETQASGIPLYLWGHSMGGGIILNYACQGQHKQDIAGYIGSGPLIILHRHSAPNKITQFIAPALANCLPNVTIDTGLDLDGITNDSEYRNFLAHDPMSVPLKGSFRQIQDFLKRGKRLYDDKGNYIEKNYPTEKPIIIFHGADDTINDPHGSEVFIEKCPAADKTLRLLPGMKHSIFSLEKEPQVKAAFNELVTWLDAHTQE
ncbi:similar to Saccharomyces cerevisiae YKL094W YJU3 Monoglyceride lipase (MGL) [Maudiozyma barnettii]|uniref:Similar to Saccharomyces cerevisiae YKL094W YJU3 Monoglyceride lipase (MGL) n=1 Tax=Maudiozyma barnettii TaxID=61262 RepID=A0A8H2VKM8_9SACH|nr:acylglycerol lipase [Kazachstania barnettii]CAB4257157.1 similar to Saccharomyces cerevisiae YKL094W YJU3 Monoglyceride lipase (MGL) [Kazachstania barnettii]CAD1779527.1 similar to Saccharomyces cerevisiae YKL094W YJU3 Monoglyceride lipase (MGL) [Kazachstania barnettii]